MKNNPLQIICGLATAYFMASCRWWRVILGLIPANKAAKLDPIEALRYE